MKKSIFLFFAAILCAIGMNAATVTSDGTARLYFNLKAVSWWNAGANGNGNFAYFFNNSTGKNAWSAHAVQYSGDTYYVVIPNGTWAGVILTRNNTSTSPSWNNKWNQTGDIVLSSTSNYISKFSENSANVTWGTAVKPVSNAAVSAASTIFVDASTTLTPSLTSNATINDIKSTTYTISPSTGASISGNTFTATAEGTYTITATVTYHPDGYSSLTSSATATTTITAEVLAEETHDVTVSYMFGETKVAEPTIVNTVGVETSVKVTAPEIAKYTFANWTLGADVATTDALTSNEINITTKAGGSDFTLTANYEKAKLTYTVTVPAGTENCYLVGAMNGWDVANPIEMTKQGENVFAVTLEDVEKTDEYKYISQKGTWDYADVQEANRTWSANDVVTAWKDPLATGLYLRGTMNEWGTIDQFKKEAVDAATATVIVALKANTTYAFKVANADWSEGYSSTEQFTATATKTLTTSVSSDAKLKTSIEGNYTFTWNLTTKQLTVTYPALPKFQVTATVNPAETGEVTGTGEYEQGKTATLTATATEGYKFVNWTAGEEVVATENPYTFNVTADVALVANFLPTYTINVTTDDERGTIEGAGTYTQGAEVTLIAEANPNYKFLLWRKKGEEVEYSKDNPLRFTATENVDLRAEFVLVQRIVKVTAENGTVTAASGLVISKEASYPHGTVAKLTATPADHYVFVSWTKGGEVVSTEPTYTFTITEDVELVANFALDTHTVAVTAENGTVSGADSYTHGTEVTLTATPDFDYEFVKWSNGSTENPLTITVAEDVTLEAIFKEVAVAEVEKPGVFSISAHKTATFATGNLQHNIGTGEWRFAKQQYQVVGEQNIQLGHPDFTGWIDMFGYSTDGKFGVNPSNKNEDYAGEFVDWGTLFPEEGWSTLSKEDWKYLLEKRTNAANLQQVAKVGDILGIMLFPDAWVMPDGVTPTEEKVEYEKEEYQICNFTYMHYTLEQWTKLEQAGAVFLPAAGRRTGGWGNTTLSENVPGGVLDADGHYKHFDNCNEYAYYWTSTKVGENVNYLINCRLVDKPNDIYSVGAAHVDWAEKGRYGQSVRLAKVVYDKHTVNATAENGTVTGAGEYTHGAEVTLTATPDFDYEFVKWSNESTENPLTIIVAEDVTLEAIFEEVAVAEVEKPGVFSISAHKTATFATGNLQHNIGTGEWRFAKQQYQVVGEQNINLGDPAFSGWIDMLGWSTNDEGNNFGVNPSNVNELYDGEFVDWGTKMGAEWSTLSADEWKYLLNTRENAATLKQIAKVGDILGLLLFPDAWVMPDGCTVEAQHDDYFNVNIYNYTLAQWAKMEAEGAMFLPAAGRRTGGYGNMINYDQVEENNEEMLNGGFYRHQDNTNIYCYYWTSTINEETKNVSYLHNIVALGNDEYTIGNGAIWGEKGRYGQSVRLAKVVYDKHTVTAIAENGTVTGAGTYTHGDTVTLTATANEHYVFVNWTAGKDTVSTEATYTFTVEADVNLVANFQEVVPVITHTVTWYTAVGETTVVILEEGATITKPDTNPEMEGYVFMGWTNECFVAEDGSDFTAIEDFGTADADKEYYAVFAVETTTGGGVDEIVTDLLNRATTDATNQNYVAWSGKTATSSAVYAGQSAGSNESIQLRSKNSNSGIVTTTSGGKAKKVTIDWNTNTSKGRTVIIYGKNSAYTQATDLYDTNNQGTELGTIVCGTSTELTISGEYAYIGICSKDGAMYLNSVSIDWETTVSGEPTTTYSSYMTTCPPEEYTIEWSVNGDVTETTTVVEGDALVLPEAPSAPEACGSKVFMGWATTSSVNANGTDIAYVDNTTTPTGDATYYAVFAKTSISDSSEDKKVTLSIKEYAAANGWVNGTKYTSVVVDENVTATVSNGSNTGKYYTSGYEWRIYESDKATLTIAAKEGCMLKAINVTYNVNNNGTLLDAPSGEEVEVEAESVTFEVGNTGTAINGQVKITAMTITYNAGETYTYSEYSTTCSGTGTDVENIEVKGKSVKMIVNGQLIIIKNGVTYNAQGQVVK